MNCYTYSQIVYESFHVEYTKNDSINIKIYICHCSYSNLKYIPNNMKVYCIKQVNQFLHFRTILINYKIERVYLQQLNINILYLYYKIIAN
ncbi:hypothetical protein C923_02545 [Plasmodium falciparum UGT5.1]|uniref:Uncharacterized protein n=4 Tax=Plasmodium falciparum TaxID=5833 RepID=W7JP40_PLAFA|nr:hypothetical protein PFFVO_02471 [Plasmodium falciparum Vietnam Oak-Knoll (FVO)]ETW43115.1 hypothetical protein PFNF135_02590 [Plasmodium falciparum NF135/5.C10]EUR72414.1 hypothetical protein PFBG_02508 [Plasmodium falciparum 7G8]EWC76754.1 hypothetical protein C923_02545 [Plasmodium falciparum UGT5.1]